MAAPSPSSSNAYRSAPADGHVASAVQVIGSDLKRHRFVPVQRRAPLSLIVRATSPDLSELEEKVEKSIKDAQETCESGTDGECRAAWDEVEELSAELSHKAARVKKVLGDPLEEHCKNNPDDWECKTFD
ncbi:hypothetical protein CBR_g19010 [Chara braunii]|uniref:CP12 domain-containing protein n=1 Tax=Chara braunii TaxID=69332 RepID=A0A388KX96_CHABU|nr:hypothetical protein CBR_g19010 [Chara braunii]|eukprot:GBG74602.1 hypothetical protein CBR_g19010 [Chara braunii]